MGQLEQRNDFTGKCVSKEAREQDWQIAGRSASDKLKEKNKTKQIIFNLHINHKQLPHIPNSSVTSSAITWTQTHIKTAHTCSHRDENIERAQRSWS